MKKEKKKSKSKKNREKPVVIVPETVVLRNNFTDCALKLATLMEMPLRFDGDIYLYPTEAKTLEALADAGSLNLTDLSKKMGVSKSAVSKTVAKLLDKHLVDKSTLGRAIQLKVTDRGQAFLNQLDSLWAERFIAFDTKLADLSEKEKQVFNKVVLELYEYLQ
ncbi:MAG: MarR family transcriptional regulator [Eubacterium aggregans]|uniref:MarR family transcriptional regulator n=1 Tax=Eubacterium aggregans TaxID=81409 RepID=UPI002B21C147|nr:MarR family transcriptional regulator [Eubacterium aggregans]MEA5072592.1 MarR family transcriptional regulator [Eubacterium aggregans]